jgi:Raf kinase inhibitor-like YbhB/YbcL family protein
LTSTVLANDGTFLPAYTCAGDNHSPPLAWTAGPTGTQSYAIVMVDTSINRYHWAIWNMAPTVRALTEALPAGASITSPVSAMQAITGTATPAYQGPCPNGSLHTYVFTAYALDVATLPGLPAGVMAQGVYTAVQSHILASGTLRGTSSAVRGP